MEVVNKTIVITGAAQGLGLAMAKSLAGQKAKLALVDINKDRLQQAKSECLDVGATAVETYQVDVSKEDQVVKLFDQVQAAFGAVNGLINNAGIIRDGMLVKAKDGKITEKLSLEKWQQVVDVNLTGVFLCAREAAEKMILSKSEGVIINLSSISRAGNFGQTNYTASKAGVAAMTVSWAKELARHNIRVCAIAPGFIATEMTASMPEEAIKRVAQHVPLQRIGQPEEIAQTVDFIFANDYLTGRVIEIDGGARI
ncbi:MAG: SDR family oxidoreductase [Gammaproteobacteria bacterium]|nr:SDR family oxidoreductase [Gammaproteobacteria bacterium]